MNRDAFTAWLRARPADSEVLWHSWSLNQKHDWAGGWVDVRVAAGDDFGRLTIVPPGTTPPDDSGLYIPYPRDLDVHAVYDPNRPNQWFVFELPLLAGELPNETDEMLLQRSLAIPTGRRRGIRTAWSADQISRALASWAAQYCGRPDLHWRWDVSIGLPPELVALIDATASGAESTYMITPGVVASEQAFETLLRLGLPSDSRRQWLHKDQDEPYDPFSL